MRGECDQSDRCNIREPLRRVSHSIEEVLRRITISGDEGRSGRERPAELVTMARNAADLRVNRTAEDGCPDVKFSGSEESNYEHGCKDDPPGDKRTRKRRPGQEQRTAANGVKLPVYMDNHATTPMDPRVLEEMLPYFMEKFGNAASRNHSFGWAGEEGVETARERVAKLIGATTKEIIFTSGATESDNLAIKGVAEMYREKGNHIITAVTEHKAVLDTCKRLEKYGYRVTYMAVQKDGLIDLEELKRVMDDKTILVTIMAANNEIGVVQPVAEIGKLCHERGVIFHTDATQAVGKIPIDVNKMNIDLMSISAHKMYGPKGVGALYVRRKNPRVQISAIIDGGGHERGMRSGTLNVPGIVGLGKACAHCIGRDGEGIAARWRVCGTGCATTSWAGWTRFTSTARWSIACPAT